MKPIVLLTALLLTELLLTGCSGVMKSKYHSPSVDWPDGWQSVTTAHDAKYPFAWGDFHDPKLLTLQQGIISRNSDVALAVLRVQQADLQAEQLGVEQAPSLSGSLGTSTGRSLSHHDLWSRGVSSSLGISMDVDLWGSQARQRDIASLNTQSSEQDLRKARLLLMESISDNYWLLGFINDQLASNRQDLDIAKYTVHLAELSWHAGKVSAVDVVNAQQSLLGVEQTTRDLKRQRLEARNAQSLLAGLPPGQVLTEPSRLPSDAMPLVRPGLPAIVLARRPDVHSAELALRKALANVDITRAALYPAFSLSGSLGSSSIELLKLFSNPTVSLSAGLSLPFLQWHKHELDTKINKNAYQQEVISFRQTLYNAMKEVDDALTHEAQLRTDAVQYKKVLLLARRSEKMSELRYRAGASPLNVWLDAQKQRRQSELQLEQNRFNQYEALARLAVVTGGAKMAQAAQHQMQK